MIQLRPCVPQQEIDPLAALVSRSFHKPEACVKESLLWKYQSGVAFCAAAVAAPQAYVAFYSNLRQDLAYENQATAACLCLDMCTHPEYRGQGLITQTSQLVYPRVVQAGMALSYGFSNEQGIQVDKHARHYGYRVVGQLYSYTLAPRTLHGGALDKSGAFPAELKHRLPGWHVAKSASYLQWRYEQKPHAQYQLLRLAQDPSRMVILHQHERQCHIVDILGEFGDASALAEYLHAVVAGCFYHWRRPVSISVLPNQWWQTILQQRGVLVVHTRPSPYYLTVKPHLRTFPADPMDPNNWWVTGGDIL